MSNVQKSNIKVVPKNIKKTIGQHECGFCGQTFDSLKFLQNHLNLCNKQNNEHSPKSVTFNIQKGKRKLEDSRQNTSKQINAIGKKCPQKNIVVHSKYICLNSNSVSI